MKKYSSAPHSPFIEQEYSANITVTGGTDYGGIDYRRGGSERPVGSRVFGTRVHSIPSGAQIGESRLIDA